MADRQVVVEAVFSTDKAEAAAQRYRAAIDACRQGHVDMNAAMARTQGMLATIASSINASKLGTQGLNTAVNQAATANSALQNAQQRATTATTRQTAAINAARVAQDAYNQSIRQTITLTNSLTLSMQMAGNRMGAMVTQTMAAAQALNQYTVNYARAVALNRKNRLRGAPAPRAANQNAGQGAGQGGSGSSNGQRNFGAYSLVFNNELGGVIRGIRNDLMIIQGIFSAITAITLTRNLIEYSDKWTEITGRIKLAIGATDDVGSATERLFDLAQKTRTPFEDVAGTFSRIAQAGKPMGMSTQFAEALTSTLASLSQAAHLTTSEFKSLMTQIPQAISFGRVSGDEFRSIMENSRSVAALIAKNFEDASGKIGITVGQLMELSKKQELPADKFFNAIVRARQEIEDTARSAPRTFSQAFQQLENDWLKTIGKIAEDQGFTKTLTDSIDKIRGAITGPEGVATIKTVMTVVQESIAGVVNVITSDTFLDAISKITLGFLKVGKDILDVFVKVSKVIDWIKTTAPSVWNSGMGNYGSGAMDGVVPDKKVEADNPIAKYYEDLVNTIKSGMERVKEARNAAKLAIVPGDDFKGSVVEGIEKWKQTTDPVNSKLESLKQRMKEMTAEAEAQLALSKARASGDQAEVIAAEAKLAAEKKITQEMRDKLPEQTKYLQGLLEEETRLKIIQANQEKDKPFRERLARLQEEAEMTRAEMTGNRDIIEQAKFRLETEKVITAELRKRNPELAAQLEAQERLNVSLKRQAEETKQWASLFEQVGNTMVDAMFRAGQEGKSFLSTVRQTVGQIAQMVIKAVLLEPLMKSIANSMGVAVQGGTGTGTNIFGFGTNGGGLGSLFGGNQVFSEGASAMNGGWATTATAAPSFGFGFANGGAFLNGDLTKAAAGDVFHAPRYFKHAGGVAQMAEAGSEAVMPLTRGRDGKLGVMAAGGKGGEGPGYQINFHIAGDATDATIGKMQAMIDRAIAQKTPGLVRQSVTSVRREIVNNPNFTRR